MMKKTVVNATILKNEQIAPDIFDMVLYTDLAKEAKAGQFVKLYPDNNKNLLPRPISICEIDKEKETLRLVYQKIGEGTCLFSTMQQGDTIRVLGNCGNGYKIFEEEKTHIFVGGGIGVPPLLETCKQVKGNKIVILGFRTGQFLKEDFEKLGATVYIATDDGSVGFKGNVVELMKQENITGDYIYSCGPKPMLQALTQYAEEKNIYTQVSMEERMACGIGVCVGCVVKIVENGEIVNKKVCKDGPVFNSLEVVYK